ncbi:hypothetical protein [Streptomyces sp. NPDC056061]|uniref:hypothetical protein n=1 Tax=Streptomyces sp. NPDC056061 TaxID=3345700 RepID=UPI0035DD522F
MAVRGRKISARSRLSLRRPLVTAVCAAHRSPAGRSLARAARRLGELDSRLADVTKSDTVHALVDTGDVLITAVGPFERFGYNTTQVVVDAGAHDVGSIGDGGFVRDLQQRHRNRARAAGVDVIPVFGSDCVPGFLPGTMAA